MIDVPVIEATTVVAPLVPADRSLREAANALGDPEVPALVVTDPTEAVAGIVTEADVVAAVAEDAVPLAVGEWMSTPVVTVAPDTSVGLAVDRMREAGVSVLPIVDDGEYLGVVTRDTLAPYVSRQRLDVTWNGDQRTTDEAAMDSA